MPAAFPAAALVLLCFARVWAAEVRPFRPGMLRLRGGGRLNRQAISEKSERGRRLRGGDVPQEELPAKEGLVPSRRGFFAQVFREVEQSPCSSENTFHVQQVQGSGDCLFHSIAIAIAFEDERCHLDMYDASLPDRVRKLRELAVDTLTLDPNRTLYLEGDQTIAIHELVSAAAEQYDVTPLSYCTSMRKEGVWGGGPEILALANALERPIHVFEPVAACNGTEFRLQLCGAFGSPAFDECGKRVCIVAADDRFPECKPTEVKRHGEGGNHFLALLPAKMTKE